MADTTHAPARGRVWTSQAVGRSEGAQEGQVWLRRVLHDDTMAAAGLPRGAVVTVDQTRMAEPGQIVLAYVGTEPPPARVTTPVESTARVVVAYLRSDDDEAWLEDADGREIPNPYHAVVCGVAGEVQAPPSSERERPAATA